MASPDVPQRDTDDPAPDASAATRPVTMAEILGDPPTTADWILALFSFALSVALAAWFQWSAVDLAWSLWATSLSLGYLTIAIAEIGRGQARHLVPGLIMFTTHFGLFHFGFAGLLSEHLPFVDPERGPRGLFACAGIAFAGGWPLIATMAFHRIREFRKLRTEAGRREGILRAYVEVFRLWSMIAILMLIDGFGAGMLAIVPVLAAAYFPWRLLFRHLARRTEERRLRRIDEK